MITNLQAQRKLFSAADGLILVSQVLDEDVCQYLAQEAIPSDTDAQRYRLIAQLARMIQILAGANSE